MADGTPRFWLYSNSLSSSIPTQIGEVAQIGTTRCGAISAASLACSVGSTVAMDSGRPALGPAYVHGVAEEPAVFDMVESVVGPLVGPAAWADLKDFLGGPFDSPLIRYHLTILHVAVFLDEP